MSRFEEGLKMIEACCGGGKDMVISLSTIAIEPGLGKNPRPCVRDVDALYENGVFYITTYAKSNKMRQIEKNNEVAFSVHFEGISGNGVGENLGWLLAPQNAELRNKLRSAFADWYDAANNEQSEDSVILAIRITNAVIFKEHGAVQYKLDFINKTEIE